jgi:hypothetical protein
VNLQGTKWDKDRQKVGGFGRRKAPLKSGAISPYAPLTAKSIIVQGLKGTAVQLCCRFLPTAPGLDEGGVVRGISQGWGRGIHPLLFLLCSMCDKPSPIYFAQGKENP